MAQNAGDVENINIVSNQLGSKSMSQLMPRKMERNTISQSLDYPSHISLFEGIAM